MKEITLDIEKKQSTERANQSEESLQVYSKQYSPIRLFNRMRIHFLYTLNITFYVSHPGN